MMILRDFSPLLRAALLALPLLCGGARGAAAEPLPMLAVPLLEGRIEVDAKLDEAVWKQAANLASLSPVEPGGQQREGTQVFIFYDREALYLGWICEDSQVLASMTERDSRFWEEEVAELFITPAGLNSYYELQWNPLGGTFDAIIHNKVGGDGVSLGIEGHWDWTAEGMTWAVDNDTAASRWVVEVRVPFRAFGQSTPKEGAVWHANFFRVNQFREGEPELSSWSRPLAPSFHQPLRFGFLVFGGPEKAAEQHAE